MPILKNAHLAIIDERKLTEYILNRHHPRGGEKARIFKAALGYDRANYVSLIAGIRRAVLRSEAAFLREDRHGRHYRVDLVLEGPAERRKFEPVGPMIEAAMSRGSPQPSFSKARPEPGAEGFGLLDVVRVRHAVPDHGLTGGEEGTIVEILDRPGRAYLVDFSGGSDDPAAADLPVFPLSADQITVVWKSRPTG